MAKGHHFPTASKVSLSGMARDLGRAAKRSPRRLKKSPGGVFSACPPNEIKAPPYIFQAYKGSGSRLTLTLSGYVAGPTKSMPRSRPAATAKFLQRKRWSTISRPVSARPSGFAGAVVVGKLGRAVAALDGYAGGVGSRGESSRGDAFHDTAAAGSDPP